MFAKELPSDKTKNKKPKSYMTGVSWDPAFNDWAIFTQIRFTEQDLKICYMDPDAHSIKKGKLQRGGHFDKLKYPTILRDKMNDFERNCVYCVENQTHSKSSIIIYGFCGHFRPEKPCRLFKYVALLPQENGLTFDVYVNQTKVCHEKERTQPCKGLAMDRLKKRVLHELPKTVRQEMVVSVDESVATTKNCTKIQSYEMIRWARSKALAENDGHDNPITALRMKYSNGQTFVKGIDDSPFAVRMYSDAGHDVVHREILKYKRKPLAHYDETGSLFRPISKDKKEDLQLALLVVRVKNSQQDRSSVTIPVFYHILSDSRAITLQTGLEYYLNGFNKRHPHHGLPFSGVVSDNSKANLHALCMAFNKMTISQYLNKCYDWLQLTEEEQARTLNNVCIIYLCDAHLTKRQYQFVDESFVKEPKFKNLVKILLANMYAIVEYDKFKQYWYNMCIFLLSDETGTVYKEAYSFLKLDTVDLVGLDIPKENASKKDCIADDTQYKRSLFYQDAKKLLEHAIAVTKLQNVMYEERLTFLQIFMKRYVYLVPLWVPVFSNVVGINPDLDKTVRKSNAPVEGKFSEIKQYLETMSIKLGQGRKKLIRVVNYLENEHFLSANVHSKQIPSSGLHSRRISPKTSPILHKASTPIRHEALIKRKQELPTINEGDEENRPTDVNASPINNIYLTPVTKQKTIKRKSAVKEDDEDKIHDHLYTPNVFKKRRKNAISFAEDNKLRSARSLFDVKLPNSPPKSKKEQTVAFQHDPSILNSQLTVLNSQTRNTVDKNESMRSVTSASISQKSSSFKERSSIMDISLEGVTLKRETLFFGNMAINIPEYYCTFDNTVKLNVTWEPDKGHPGYSLSIADFKTLFDDRCLSDNIIEISQKLLLKSFSNKSVVLLSTNDSRKMFMDGTMRVQAAKLYARVEHILSYNIIVAPILKHNHYTLVIIDFKKHAFYYYNSSVREDSEERKKHRELLMSFKQALDFYKKNGVSIAHNVSGTWKQNDDYGQQQNDGSNCGIFVLHNAECHLNNEITVLNPSSKRKQIQNLILQNLVIDWNICPVCNMSCDDDIAMHYCELCDRWLHYTCDNREDITQKLPDETDYVCIHCKLFFHGKAFGKKIKGVEKLVKV